MDKVKKAGMVPSTTGDLHWGLYMGGRGGGPRGGAQGQGVEFTQG